MEFHFSSYIKYFNICNKHFKCICLNRIHWIMTDLWHQHFISFFLPFLMCCVHITGLFIQLLPFLLRFFSAVAIFTGFGVFCSCFGLIVWKHKCGTNTDKIPLNQSLLKTTICPKHYQANLHISTHIKCNFDKLNLLTAPAILQNLNLVLITKFSKLRLNFTMLVTLSTKTF